MRSTRDFFIGTLTGLTVGLLVAPRTGEESRRWLKAEYDKRMAGASGSSRGTSLKDRLMTFYEQVKAEVTKYTEQQKNQQQRLADTGRFDYQREREQRFQNPTTDPPATT